MKLNTIAFIPLRGGSKSIPLKNIRPIAGKPLALWTIEAAANCERIERVFVCTDDDRIREVVESARHPKVEVVGRSAVTATDTASTESAMLEFAAGREFEQIVLIQATSPLLSSEDLTAGLCELERSGADSLLSVVEQKRFIWQRTENGLGLARNYDPQNRPRRQDFQPYYVENGAFYVCRRVALLASRCRISGPTALYVMPEESYYELDEPADWRVIEALLIERVAKAGQADIATRARKIKLFLTDVDGVLTDAGMYYSETGDELKKFNTRDGKGIELLRNAGIQTGIITSENTKLVARRAAKLKMDHLVQGAVDKLPVLLSLLKQTGLRAEEVAYIGDDLADIPVLRAVGLAACPADAIQEVKNLTIYHCKSDGGAGCVREFAECILKHRI